MGFKVKYHPATNYNILEVQEAGDLTKNLTNTKSH